MKSLSSFIIFVGIIVATQLSSRAGEPTFCEHIAPIIFKNCVSCHRNGEIGPFSLTNYQEVKSHATMIKFVTSTRYMPPWTPIHGYGSFAQERGLSNEQIILINQWVDNNMPFGDSTKIPALPEFPTGSQLGTPDVVLTMSQKYTIKGNFKDTYRNFVVPTELLEDKDIAAIEFRPGNPKIVHHVNMYLDTSGTARALDALDPEYGYHGYGGIGFTPAANLIGWIPGISPHFFPASLGIHFRKKSDIVLQFHYAPSATEQSDQSTINIFYKKDTPVRPLSQFTIEPRNLPTGQSFVIPPQKKKSFMGTITITEDISLMAIAPHMHLLGLSAKAFAITPTNDTIPLIAIDNWNFNWQGVYFFKNLVKLPKQSVVYYESLYDNTSDNPENPSFPPKPAVWGELTSDEMFMCYFFYVPYKTGDESIGFGSPNSVENEKNLLPAIPTLECYPNPVSDLAELRFGLNGETSVSLIVYDLIGNKVLDVLPKQILQSGQHSIKLPVDKLASGLYICRLQYGAETRSTLISKLP
jgi:hypothetical protein